MSKDDDKDKKYSRLVRVGSFVAGFGFLALGAADAMLDPFPGPETFFAGTGISLIAIAATGSPSKTRGGE